jgi:ssDNA-binding Zn-finger/Zn-ribbon topoisomerase 1
MKSIEAEKKEQLMNEYGEYSTLKSVRECPICHGELEKGFLNAIRGVFWSEKKHYLGMAALDYVMPGAIWTSETVPALKCEKCGIVISDLRAAGYTPKSFLKKCVECGKEIPIASETCSNCGAKQPTYEVP